MTGGTVTAADLPGTGYGKSHTQVNIESRILENCKWCIYVCMHKKKPSGGIEDLTILVTHTL